MKGGAQSHLMRCDDGGYYVVKFQNNPQAAPAGRILVNELLGSRLAARLGLPVAEGVVVEVPQELIDQTADLEMVLGERRIRCRAGLQFGSRYPGDPAETVVHDFLPEEQLRSVTNLEIFAGALCFDKWMCNTNGRQAVFVPVRVPDSEQVRYEARLIDFGFVCNAGQWDFPDAPLRGLYARCCVYDGVRGLDSFEPWLTRIEKVMTADRIGEVAGSVPLEWYDADRGALERLIEQLDRRRQRVRELIQDARNTYRQPFRNWK
jgi:hypothetical protein